ncbi:hypothetical protein SERLA73DRAFT_188639, partial [Serpula lacrymans var. lacrymans S7.3]
MFGLRGPEKQQSLLRAETTVSDSKTINCDLFTPLPRRIIKSKISDLKHQQDYTNVRTQKRTSCQINDRNPPRLEMVLEASEEDATPDHTFTVDRVRKLQSESRDGFESGPTPPGPI